MKNLARLEAFGLSNPLVAWSIAHGGFDDLCTYCRGAGLVIDSPCEEREAGPAPVGSDFAPSDEGAKQEPRCTRETGCALCRRECPICRGSGLPKAEPVLAEDFGDDESRAMAERMFPTLRVDDFHKRIDMDARAL